MTTPTLDENHVYHLNGEIVSGVTTLLQSVVDYSMVDVTVLAFKAKLGTYVHLATEYFDNKTLDIDSLDAALLPYVNAWILFNKETGFVTELSEHVVYHERYHYAGTLDRVGILNDERILLDIKCTSVLEPHVGVQLAAYFEAENSTREKPDRVKKRFALQLKKDGSYNLKRYKNIEDFKVFTSLLNIYNWRHKHDRAHA